MLSIEGNRKVEIKSLSQNIAALIPVEMSLTQIWVRKVQIGISRTNVDRKMKIKIKRNSEVRYSFMKLFSRNLESCRYHLKICSKGLKFARHLQLAVKILKS